MRRTTPGSFEPDKSTVRFCGRTLDLAGRVLLNSQEQEIPLTRDEFAALSAFVQNPGRALSREYLRQFISGRDLESDDRSIDMLIGRLRRKIEERTSPRLIATVPGAGYKLVARASELEWDAAPRRPRPAPADRTHLPERRQVTILVCQAVGLASLAAAIDPEDLQVIVGTVQQRFAELIDRFRGTVAPSLGDGMLAYFGYPRAREDDAGNAVRAGLELIRRFSAIRNPVVRAAGRTHRNRNRACRRRRFESRGRPRTKCRRRRDDRGRASSGMPRRAAAC